MIENLSHVPLVGWLGAEDPIIGVKRCSQQIRPPAVLEVQSMYRGEVLLQYSVHGNNHTLWTDAGFDRDPGWLRQHIRTIGYRVRYNPEHPEQSTAERC